MRCGYGGFVSQIGARKIFVIRRIIRRVPLGGLPIVQSVWSDRMSAITSAFAGERKPGYFD
jgi:hypothetical protein